MAYRDTIDVQRDVSAAGDPIPDHEGTAAVLYRSVPCSIVITAGDETYKGRQLEARTTHVVRMRNLPEITPAMRVMVRGGYLNGRTLHITHVRPIDQRGSRVAELELYCEEADQL